MIIFIYTLGLLFTFGIFLAEAMKNPQQESKPTIGEQLIIAIGLLVWPFSLGIIAGYYMERNSPK